MNIEFKSKRFYTTPFSHDTWQIGDVIPDCCFTWEKAIERLEHPHMRDLLYFEDNKLKYIISKEEAFRINNLMEL